MVLSPLGASGLCTQAGRLCSFPGWGSSLVRFGVGEEEGEGGGFGFAMDDAEAATGAAFLVEDGGSVDHADGLDVAGAAEGACVAEDALGVEAFVEMEGDFADGWDGGFLVLMEGAAGAGLDAGHVLAPVAGGGGGIEEGGAFEEAEGGAEVSDDLVGTGLGAGVAAFAGGEEGLLLGKGAGRADEGDGLLFAVRVTQGFADLAGQIAEAEPEELAAAESGHGGSGDGLCCSC